jgi:hypothetical protein
MLKSLKRFLRNYQEARRLGFARVDAFYSARSRA